MEHKDATDEEKKISESNAGTYWFDAKELLYALDNITNNNVQNEYYLTDSLEILIAKVATQAHISVKTTKPFWEQMTENSLIF